LQSNSGIEPPAGMEKNINELNFNLKCISLRAPRRCGDPAVPEVIVVF
jgi:hypothetical protein